MRAPTIIRTAGERDLPAIVAILNLEIAESPYVYAEAPLTLDDRRSWLQMHRSASLPVVVATDPGSPEVLGWASLSPYRAASGYRFTLEASVYVARGAHRRGIGIALFELFGYVEAARLKEVGRKFERWRTQLLLLKGFPR